MARKRSDNPLTERAQHLLRVLVKQYIDDGQPVGSKALAKASGLDLSAATIRNIMADLEALGFLRAPHTSAGRVPTVRGYRFFVDSLISVQQPDRIPTDMLQERLSQQTDTQKLLSSVSEFLSGLTSLAGIVTLPRMQHLEVTQIEFLPLSENRVLAILVMNGHDVQNRILQMPRPFGADELQRIANYLNAHYAGKEIAQVRREVLQELRDTHARMDRLMRDAVTMAESVFRNEADAGEDYVMVGQTKLMEFEELSNVDKLRQLFEAFSQKRDILQLLDQCMQAQGVQIFIGEESGYEPLDDCSVVTSSYTVDGQPVGVLGVIGPTRMAYDKVIPVVDITAKILGAALNSRH